MDKKCFSLVLVCIFCFISVSNAAPPAPARIGGILVDEGNQITSDNDDGYTFEVTKQDGTSYDPAAQDTDGLNSLNWYYLNIPIYEQNEQPGGAVPGETAVIHVYKNGTEISVTSPVNGEFTVGESASTTELHINGAFPAASAGEDQNVDEGDTVTLDASQSSDPDDGIASYQWTQTGGKSVTISDPNAQQPSFTAPEGPTDSLVFELTITDNTGLQARDTCIVNVNWVNDPPVADAGNDQTVNSGTVVKLDGSKSADPDDGIKSYMWTQTEGASVTLSNPAISQPTFTAPNVGTGGETLKFELAVTDNDGLQTKDTVNITVRYYVTPNPTPNPSPNPPPTYYNNSPISNAGPDQNVQEGNEVTLDGSNSSDPDGNTITYLWEQIEGISVTLSDTTSSQPSFTVPEVGPDGESLKFRLTVTDTGGLKNTDEIIINIINTVNPPVADAGADQNVNEGETVMLDGSNSHDPEQGNLTFKWIQISGVSVTLSDSGIAAPTFVSPEIGTDGDSLVFELEVSSEAGLKNTDTVIINVIWINNPPTADAGADQNVYQDGEVVLDGSASWDSDDGIASYTWTQISGTSVTLSDPLSVQPSFAAPEVSADGETLVFELTVQDKAGLTAADRVTVNVMGGSSNQPPVSHAGEDQTVEEGSTVTLSAVNSTDNDGSIASYLWTQKEGTPVTLSDASNPQPTFVTPPTGSEGMSLSFEVTVTDDKGLQAGDTVAVTVNDNGITDFSEDVISFKTTTDKNEGIKAEKGYIVYLSSVSPDTIPDEVNRPAELPYGLTDIIVKCSQNGDTAEITVFLPEPAPENFGLYEYSEGSGWKEIIDNISFDTERKQIRLTLTDGGSGDSDGISDGMIHYLFGVGGNPSDAGSDDDTDSGGGGGSCFINTSEVSPVYKMVLTGIIFCMLLGGYYLNRRKN